MREFSLLILLISFKYASAQIRNDCSDAPSEAARLTCLNLRRMDQNARDNNNNEPEEVWPPSLPG
jgi:hypothetical protein